MLKWTALAALVLAQESFQGKEPPGIDAAKEQWINAAGTPSLRALKGKVVWLEFGVLG